MLERVLAVGRGESGPRSVPTVLLLVALAVALPWASPARAATFTVDSTIDDVDVLAGDGVCATATATCTLRAAVQEANAWPGADTIDLPAGVYLLTRNGTGEDAAAQGDLDVLGDLTIAGAGLATTVIDGAASVRVLEVFAGVTARVSGATIRNGRDNSQGAGGARVTGTLDLSDAVVSSCSGGTKDGGAFQVDGGTLLLTRVTVSNNSASFGGGIWSRNATLTLTGVTLDGNSASNDGGGINAIGTGTVDLTNVTISGNSAGRVAGGINSDGPTVTLTSVTMSGNAAATVGGGIFRSSGSFTIRNTIVADSPSGADCSGAITTAGTNIDSDGTCGAATTVDPQLGPLQDNGGTTWTHALPFNSPAIDAGTAVGCPATDQRGQPRPIDGDASGAAACDVGAYESQLVPSTISGVVFEDRAGDAVPGGQSVGDAANPGRAGVTVLLYADGGDGLADGSDDTPSGSATTAAGGSYQFAAIDGTYWVVVDSKTVSPSAGFNGGSAQGDVWSQQTWGAGGARCAGGAGGTLERVSAGPCFGGRRGGVSDDASALSGAEHVTRVAISGGDVAAVDFGFSFNVITETRDLDDDPGANRSVQGGVRQLIQNGNAIGGANAGRFVPAVATNASGAGGDWWEVTLRLALPELADAGTRLDGTAFDLADGSTVRDPHAAIPENTTGPELMLDSTAGGPGLHVSGAATAIADIGVIVATGAGPSGAGLLFDGAGVAGSVVQGFMTSENDGSGISFRNGATSVTVSDCLVSKNGIADPSAAGIELVGASSITLTRCTVVDNPAPGIDLHTASNDSNSITDGVIRRNGGGPATGDAGIVVGLGSSNTISGNVVSDNAGDGILVVSGTGNAISANSISANGELGIDLGPAPQGDGVTANDPAPDGDGGPNALQNAPVLSGALVRGGATKMAGTLVSAPGATYIVEFFSSSAADPSGSGEGEVYLGSGPVATDGSGQGDFAISLPLVVATGDAVTATARSATGDTSEFSAAVAAAPSREIAGTVYHDLDANGALDMGELGIGQVWVKLISGGVALQAVAADLDTGDWLLPDVVDGAYTAIVDDNASLADATPTAPAGWLFQNPAAGSQPVDVAGADVAGIEFGLTFDFDLGTDCSCGYEDGGLAQRTIAIDGLMADWGPVLTDGDNNACDATDSTDLDYPVQSTGRNLLRTAVTFDATYFYMWTQRVGSSSNTQNFIYYSDTDNDGVMTAGEPVVVARWQGSNGSVDLELYTYDDLGSGGDPLVDASGFADGYSMPGDLDFVKALPAGSGQGATVGSAAGTQMEWRIAWAELGLAPGSAISWHTGSTNSNPGAAGLAGKIDDNVGGCGGQCTGSTQFSGITAVPLSSAPGDTVYASHEFTNTGNGTDRFDFTWTSSGDFAPASVTFYRDLGTVGQFDAGVDTPIADTDGDGDPDTGSMAPGGVFDLLVAVELPPPPAYGSAAVRIVATSNFEPGCGQTIQPVSHGVDEPLFIPAADLAITKSDGAATATPGLPLGYTITVSNAGPDDAIGAAVADAFDPAVFDVPSVSWTCAITTAGVGSDACADPGPASGDIGTSVDLSAGAVATFSVTAPTLPGATGTISNTATVTATSELDPDTSNNAATDGDTVLGPSADLSITKDDGQATYTPGAPVTWTITVSNAGPSDVTGATVTDSFPAEVTSATWTCAGNGGASCTAGGSGDINDTVDIPVGGAVVYTVTAATDPAATGDLVNTASVASPVPDPGPGDESDGDTDTVDASADLTVTKDDGQATYTPGVPVTYTITVANAGPSGVTGATVTDSFPAEVTSATWTCAGTGGASCTAGGSGDISDLVDIPAGEQVVYTVTAVTDPAATGDLVNTASVAAAVSDPNPGDESDADTDALAVSADLSVTKDDGQATYTPGSPVTYTITVTNAGPSDVTGATVTDTLPAEITAATWTCAGSGGASCTASGNGDVNDAVDLPAGSSVVYTVTAAVDPGATGDLVNTATVATAVPDPNPGDESATDVDAPGVVADLGIAKDDGQSTYAPGAPVTYTITVTNAGPSHVTGATVADSFPAEITGATWTCAGSGGATCTAANSGDVNDTVDIPAGGSVVYTVTASTSPSAGGDLQNTATVSVPVGVTDPDPANDTATDVDTRELLADLAIGKTDGTASAVPGTSLAYTITVVNNGPSNVAGAVVADALDPAVFDVAAASWTCSVTSGTGACGAPAGAGDLATTADLSAGSQATYVVTAPILPSAGGTISNTAMVAPPAGTTDPIPGNNAATDDDTVLSGEADLSLAMAVDQPAPLVGSQVVFTLTVTNAGPSQASAVAVAAPLPPGYTWVADDGGAAYDPAGGTWTMGTLAAGGAGALQITALVEPGGPYTVAAEVAAAGEPDPDSTPGNGIGLGEDDEASATTTPVAVADLSLTKTVDNPVPPVGGTVTFTLTLSNAGPSEATGIQVADLLPTGYTYVSDDAATRSTTYAGGMWAVGALPAGASMPLNITAVVESAGEYLNVAEVAAANEADPDSTPGNGAAGEDDQAQQSVTPTGMTILLHKNAGASEVVTGDAVHYSLRAENLIAGELAGVTIEDLLPAGFKYVQDSARLVRAGADGQLGTIDDEVTVPGVAGNRPLIFGPIDFAAGEVVRIDYVLRVGTGAGPGRHVNRATPMLASMPTGNVATAEVELVADPLFDLSIIVGKVFEDHDGDGQQDAGERGVPQAMVVLDDGTYALTDAHGRYHFPAVRDGQRLLKLNLRSLPAGARTTGDAVRVLWVSPGLIARASFGVVVERDVERIGRAADTGLGISAEQDTAVDVRGNAETLSLLINGSLVPLLSSGVDLRLGGLDDVVRLAGGQDAGTVSFRVDGDDLDRVQGWTLEVMDAEGRPVSRREGEGPPGSTIVWDGRHDDGTPLRAGAIYQYQVRLHYAGGTEAATARRLFGVDRETVVSLTLTGSAFESGSDRLSSAARRALDEAGELLRQHPDEQVLIEGHTDSVGSETSNVELSRRRAETAVRYLVKQHGLDRRRFVLRSYGESRPIASNAQPEGRELNRRVEIRGALAEAERAELLDVHRQSPVVRVNGDPVEVSGRGRFATRVDPGPQPLSVEMGTSQGQWVATRVAVPELVISQPAGEFVATNGAAPAGRVRLRIEGRTEPGARLTMDGRRVDVGADGGFAIETEFSPGETTVGFVATNGHGASRLANLRVAVNERDAGGRPFVVAEPIPFLTVALPPAGLTLPSPTLPLSGHTEPGNTVAINGEPLAVAADGSFETTLELEPGSSTLVIEVRDPAGRTGRIEREVRVARHELFLLAFGEGRVGKLQADGAVEAANTDTDGLYTEGRLAFYLKGRIAGKYLITAAFDSGRTELDELFRDLTDDQTERLARNLDPDRYYPIYGDGSTVVYDAESQGKFYLGVESETIRAVVGNYPLSLTDTELAAYQRTLFGARFDYQSLSRTRFDEPDTRVVLFTAEVRQLHVRDQLRATGGSLYYLSHQDVVEGSEHVTLVVRDTITGLVLRRTPQRQNADYTIKYEEGRLMFHRPISSVAASQVLIDDAVLDGHPVFVEVDYETRVDSFEKTTSGGRVRQQLGDRVAVGATHVDDQLESGEYQLTGVDAEVRLGENSRLVAEYAESEGTDSLIFVSADGGLSYSAVPASGIEQGAAWKVAAELDVGEWFDRPDRMRLNLYAKQLEPGFFSRGNFLEQGTTKTGALASMAVTEGDTVRVRHDREDRSGAASLLPGAADETTTSTAQWEHRAERWGVTVEYQQSQSRDAAGATLNETSAGAASLWATPSDRLTARAGHQQTLDGADNDRTSLGVDYQALENLALEASASDGDRGSSAEAGAVLKLGDSNLYLTERLTSDGAGDRTATVVGARSRVGPKSTIYSEYQWERSEREQKAISLIGLQRRWDVTPGLRITFAGEAADVASSAAAADRDRSAVSVGLTWADDGDVSVRSRHELRREEGDARLEQWLTFTQLDYRLNHELTLLAKYRYSATRDRDLDLSRARLEERSVAVAFRPVDGDRLNGLARYTRLVDRGPDSPLGPGIDREMDVISVEAALQASRRIEWLAKGAWRAQQERFPQVGPVKSELYLTIQRLNYNVWKKFDLGLEYRILVEQEANDRRQGWLSEWTWRLLPQFRVGAGYNFTDFSDDEFSQNDYSVRGWFLRVQGAY